MTKEKVEIKCPDCLSKAIVAKRDGTSWCRHCGWIGLTQETIKTTELTSTTGCITWNGASGKNLKSEEVRK